MFLETVYGVVVVCAGLVGLWWFGDRVVQYTVEVAQSFGITTFFIGFIILAIAADIPEIAVALMAAFKGVNGISAGNLIGGNFVDVAVVIGATLFFARSSLVISAHDRFKLVRMLMLTALILILLLCIGSIGKLMGLVLVGVYIASIVWIWKKKVSHSDVVYQEVVAVQQDVSDHKSVFLTSRTGLIIKLAASFGGVLWASSITVNSALELSALLAWPVEAIGATLLALGTSLPEFAISFSSLRRGQDSLALGPTLGTVLEQSTLILGILALASAQPVRFEGLVGPVIFSLIAFAILCHALVRYERVGRGTGTALGLLLVAYIFYYLW